MIPPPIRCMKVLVWSSVNVETVMAGWGGGDCIILQESLKAALTDLMIYPEFIQ